MKSHTFRKVVYLLQQITHRNSSNNVELMAMEARDAVISKSLRQHLLDLADNPAHFEEDEIFLEMLLKELKLEV